MPYVPGPVASVTDGTAYPALGGAAAVAVAQMGTSHYALVASTRDDGLQIINVTDPANPGAVAALFDSTPGNYTDYAELEGASSVATARIGTSHYALVASHGDDGLQIINITDPRNPSPVAALTNGTAYPALGGASSVAAARIGDGHYALVASRSGGGNGGSSSSGALQIINITDPASPRAVTALTDGMSDGNGGTYAALGGAYHVAVARIGTSHYALVASYDDDGLQIIDVTDPANPRAVASVTDGGAAYTTLLNSAAVAVAQIGDSPLRASRLARRRRPPDNRRHGSRLPRGSRGRHRRRRLYGACRASGDRHRQDKRQALRRCRLV